MQPRSFLFENAPWLAAGVVLTLSSSFGQTFFISLFAGKIQAEFDLTHGAWGGIYSLGTGISALVMIWAGTLADRFRVRLLGTVTLIGLATACVAMATNHSLWLLPVIIFFLRFFGQGMCSHIATVAMTRWFASTRGRALSVATSGFSIGEALFPLLFVALMLVFDWRYLWIGCALAILCAIPALLRLLNTERTPQSLATETSTIGMNGRHWTRAETVRHPLFWSVMPALLGPPAFNTAFFFHQVHFASIKGWSHVELVALFPLYTAASFLFMLLSGWALDKFGTDRLIPYLVVPIAFAFAVFGAAQTSVGLTVGLLGMAMTSGAFATLPNAFWAEFFGTSHIGAIKSVAVAIMVFGSAIGPGLTGVLIDFGIGLETQYFVIAAYFVFATVLMAIGVSRARANIYRGLRR